MYINGNTGRLVERYRKEVDADPQRYHVTGWLRGGINQEKMEKIIEEKGADMGKEWTPEQKEKFKATMAAKRAERSAAVAGADPVKQDDDKRQAKILRDREYRARKRAEEQGIVSDPKTGGSVIVYCMRCGLPMVVHTGQFRK